MLDILEDITKGRGKMEDLETPPGTGRGHKARNLFVVSGGLLLTLSSQPCATFVRNMKLIFKEGRCPSLMCQTLIAYYILPEKCARWMRCLWLAPAPLRLFPLIRRGEFKVIDQQKCVKCNTCLAACPPQYDVGHQTLTPPTRSRVQFTLLSLSPRWGRARVEVKNRV